MIGKKINQLATELAPVSTDLTIIGDPTTGVSKKITLAQLGAIFSGAVSFYTNLAGFPAVGDINVIYCAKDTQKLYLWNGSAYTEVFPSQALLNTYQLRSEKGVSNGYASLDSGGKVPISQLPSSIMEYKGTWNAATNTPTLANGTGDTGDVYVCNVAGTVNFGAGAITFAVGDYVIYSGSIWQRSSGAVGTVTSVGVTRSGDALAITGSPITTSGTINLGFAGNSTQYINGAGNLVTFPGIINEAQNLITEVYNKTGATLTKGTVVYINGGQGNLPAVTKALATGDSTSAQTYGIVRNDITNNNNGYVVVAGRISDLDTQAYTEGTQLYLSPTTAGTYTSTKPYAPQHLVYVGIVVRAHPTQGVVEVKIQNGYELDELHNVAAQSPDNNDILQYKTSTSLWTKVAGTTSNIAEGSNLYYTDARSRAALSFTAGSGAYNSTTGVITIPTNTNQLTNGAAYITLGSLSAGAGISYNNTTGVIASTITQYTDAMARASISGGTGISYNSTTGVITNTITQYTDAMARASISLTTTGTSGAATYNSTTGVLNVPQYAPDLSGYVPTSRTLTINGTAFDLSANRSWSVGTVTSVGLSSATSGVTIGSTPITTSGTITLAIATASGSQQGLLSSTDWTTFNNKQNALTNPVTGTGTTNYLPKFTGTSTIGNSNILIQGGGFYLAGSEIFTNANGGIFFNGNGSYATGIFGYSTSNNIRVIAPNQIDFHTASTQRMLIDASGNLGLGVTPSAWGSGFAIAEYKGGFIGSQSSSYLYQGQNLYFNGTNWVYAANGSVTMIEQSFGSYKWYNAPSGTAGNAISFTQAMTLTASGRLLINKTNEETYQLDVNGTGRFSGDLTIGSGSQIYLTSGDLRFSSNAGYGIVSQNGSRLVSIQNGAFGVTGAATFSSSVTANGGIFSSNISSLTYEPSSAGAIQPGVSEFISTGFNVAGASSTDVSTISVPSNTQWKAIITGGFANNYEGGGLVSPNFSRDIDGTNSTITVGSTTLTFSRNASTGKLQVSNSNASVRATFVGTIHLITFPQSVIPTNTRAFFGNVGIGTTSPSEKLDVNGNIKASNLYSGTYTPTITLVTNAASSTAYVAQYYRVGNVVTVSGVVTVAASVALTNTRITMSLPINSNFDYSYRAGGGGGGRATSTVCVISASGSASTVQMDFVPSSTGSTDYFFSYTYQIL